jgi:Dolichyl-phosphate-mannose-protein mannosyltransferase
MGPVAEEKWFDRIPDGAFFTGACLFFLALALCLAALTGLFSGSVWSLGDTRIFYRMADLIVQGGTPYVDFKDPKPPLIFFLLAVPQALGLGMAGGLFLVAIANGVSAAVILKIGWQLYGRGAGLLAGLLFTVNAVWAEGYFVLTEPFTIAFMLLSLYFLLGNWGHRYLAAGICAGLAIGFKQYALLLVPLSLFFTFRKGETRSFLPYLAGVALPLLITFAALFVAYGAEAGAASMYWSFGIAPTYFTEGSIGEVSAYRLGDPAEAAGWVMLALSLFAPLVALAAASVISEKCGQEEELFVIAAVAFAATLAIRPFLHYWAFTLPFIVLLAAGAFGNTRAARRRLPGKMTPFLIGGTICAALLSAAAFLAYLVMTATWRPMSLIEQYGLADIVLKATARYFGNMPSPVAVAFDLDLSSSLPILLVFCLLTSVAVAVVAGRLYGRIPALVAGLLFTVSIAFTIGYMQPSDGLALLLLTTSLYFLLLGSRGSSWAAGLMLGTAIVIKPLAVVLALAALFLLIRGGKSAKVPGFIICLLAPVAFFCVAVTGSLALGVSWGIQPYGDSTIYLVPDALMAMLNFAAAGAFITVTVVAAAAAFLWKRAGPVEEFLLLAVVVLFCTLFFTEFIHYWFLGLPFAAVLCMRPFSEDRNVIMRYCQ